MPTIAAGSSATFSIPIGQVANVSGQGIAVLVFPTSSPIALTGNSVIGPFPVTRIVNVTASVGAQIDYTVAVPATSGGPSAALGIAAKPTISTPAIAGTSINGAFSAVGTPTPSTAIAWLLDGAVISSATAIPYASQTSDSGKSLQLRVTATNSSGTLVSTSDAITVQASGVVSFKNTGTMRLVGTQNQILYPAPVTFSGGRAARIVKVQAPGPAIGCRISVHNLSPTVGLDYVKASIAATDVAAFDTVANAYNVYVDGVTHNVTASGADPLGFIKATWGGATQSRRLELTNPVLPAFGYNNQQDTVTSDPIMGLVPKRATDRANEEYYYLLRFTAGLVQNQDGLCTPTVGVATSLVSDYTSTNAADCPLVYGGDLGLVDGVDGAYTIPAALKPEAQPVFSIEWIYPSSLAATTLLEVGDSITEGYRWPRIAANRKSTPSRPIHHVNLGGSTTRTASFLGNMYLYLQSNARPDYVLLPIISVNNYSPISSFNLTNAQAEFTRLQEVATYLTSLGIKIIWWTPFNFGANPAPSDMTSAWGYLYNSAKAYAASNGVTFMDINGDPRLVRSVYNASTNPTGWIDPDNTHPSNPAGINGFAAVYTDTLTALGF